MDIESFSNILFFLVVCSKADGAEEVPTPVDPRAIPDKKKRIEFIAKAQSSETLYSSCWRRAKDE
jgi:hypothetical protein